MESIMECTMTGRRFFKRCAKKVLYNDWLTQILAFFVVAACVSGINLFGVSICSVLVLVTGNEVFANMLFSVYRIVCIGGLVLPLFYGVIYFEKQALSHSKANLANLFYAFSSFERLNRAYYVFFNLFFRTLLCYLPAIVVSLFKDLYYFEGIFGFILRYGSIDVVATGIRTLIVLLIYLGFVLSSKYYVTVYLGLERENMSFGRLLMTTKICMYGERVKAHHLAISFLPLCVISLFTMGFLFIVFTVPYMLLTFTCFSKYIYEKEMYTKSAQSLLDAENDIEN